MTVVDTTTSAGVGATGQVVLPCRGEQTVSFIWGRADRFGTAAYWIGQTRSGNYRNWLAEPPCLVDGLVFCLLGGYGITAELASAYFALLKERQLVTVSEPVAAANIEVALREAVTLNGRSIHYRFPTQRSGRIASALSSLRASTPPSAPTELRSWLMTLKGIGPKTASWIVRDVTRSSDIAVIDIHLIDACRAAGVFRPEWDVRRDYLRMEAAFLALARFGDVDACELDVCIWDQTRTFKRNGGKFDATQTDQ